MYICRKIERVFAMMYAVVNRFGVYMCSKIERVLGKMHAVVTKAERSGITYCMLQPRLTNGREHKVSYSCFRKS